MLRKKIASIASAAALMAVPGRFTSTAAAQMMSRGPVAEVSVIPMIDTGMRSLIPDASFPNLLAPSALSVRSSLSTIAAVPFAGRLFVDAKVVPAVAMSIIPSPASNNDAAKNGAALNELFDNSHDANRPDLTEPGRPVMLDSSNGSRTQVVQNGMRLSQQMESLVAILAFTEGAKDETEDGIKWRAGLVRGQLNKLLPQIIKAHSQVASSSARIALTYARAMIEAEIEDSFQWQRYYARKIYQVFDAINGSIVQAIDGEKQQGTDTSPVPIASQAERLESLHLLAATIEAAIYETGDGRRWASDLVRSKLNEALATVAPALEKVGTSQAQIALIRIRAYIEAEITDSGSWPGYRARAVESIFRKFQDYVAQAVKAESSQP
ncbi:MAG: hypothetical protein AAB268_03555 [Elusimicrobiota bacterium]